MFNLAVTYLILTCLHNTSHAELIQACSIWWQSEGQGHLAEDEHIRQKCTGYADTGSKCCVDEDDRYTDGVEDDYAIFGY